MTSGDVYMWQTRKQRFHNHPPPLSPTFRPLTERALILILENLVNCGRYQATEEVPESTLNRLSAWYRSQTESTI
jgi:hypothetical protein